MNESQRQADYIMEFVGRVDEFLQASLSRQGRPIHQELCDHCPLQRKALWRCVDCALATTLCRACMRATHHTNPFHRVERWTGTHFRPAEIWEVGTYVLIPHSTDQPVCNALKFQTQYLERFEVRKDMAEQDVWQESASAPASTSTYSIPQESTCHDSMRDERMQPSQADEAEADAAFFRCLDDVREQDGHLADEGFPDFFDGDDDCEVDHADEDIAGFQPYLPTSEISDDTLGIRASPTSHCEVAASVPTADAFNNTYVRVVHTNGIHHLALVACNCMGERQIPLDLIASRLYPTSFTKIRTLFTEQVLDHYRLCNLELKASAYQFYQLIRRITLPMRPAEVVNLYHELRHMSRLWHWMKKLKWAGYGHNKKDALNPDRGSLANFCPACPQVGINLSENWTEDKNR